MDFLTFRDRLLQEDLKSIKSPEDLIKLLDKKYLEKEVLGAYRMNKTFSVVHFKQKLWEKLAFFKDGDWFETRVSSLTNKLPEAVQKALEKKLKKNFKIIKIDSVISEEVGFYFYLIIRISGKKKVIHINKEGEVLVNTKYIENHIRLKEEENDSEADGDSSNDLDDEELEEVEISDEDKDD